MSLFYIRPIDPLGEDPPFFSPEVDIFECENSQDTDHPCNHKHFNTLYEAKRAIVEASRKSERRVSSDKVMSYSSEGYLLKISGEYPAFDEVEHFEKFLLEKTGQDDVKDLIEVVCLKDGIYLYCSMTTTLSGNNLNSIHGEFLTID